MNATSQPPSKVDSGYKKKVGHHEQSFGKINSIHSLRSGGSSKAKLVSVPGAGYRLLDGRGGARLPDMNDLVILKEASLYQDTQDQDEPDPPNF